MIAWTVEGDRVLLPLLLWHAHNFRGGRVKIVLPWKNSWPGLERRSNSPVLFVPDTVTFSGALQLKSHEQSCR